MNKLQVLLTIALVYTFSYNSSAQIFSEQSSVVGIDHVYNARGLMGGGAAFFDFDLDGDEDLYLTGGLARDVLYRNNGDGSFTKTENSNGLEATAMYNTTAVITGDINNDGYRDIFVSTWEANGSQEVARNLLFLNKGDGTFEEVGANVGITQAAFSIGANFVDYNRDGFLDIHVMNHVETPAFLYDSYGVIIGFDHDCYDNFFYLNNGGTSFTEVAGQIGVNDNGCALAALPSDYDMDGDLDIFIANDFGPFIVPNALYQNNYPDDTFSEIGAATGAGIPMYGMGIAAGDYDHDLDLDYYITNLGQNVLMENDNGNFTDVAISAQVESTYAVGSPTDFATGWGTAFFDIDNDTWLDLFVANGRIPSLSTLPTAMNDPNKLYLNNGDKTFSDISALNSVDDPAYSRGMAYADYDNDGDLDFVVVNLNEFGEQVKLYRNDSNGENNYIQFALEGTKSNKDAFGAKVWIYAGGETFLREVAGGGGSFCSQSTSIVHFGLGDIAEVDSVRVDWPSGIVDHLSGYEVNQKHNLLESFTSSNKDLLQQNFALSVLPNPFEQSFTIEITGEWKDEKVWVELLALDGKSWSQEYLPLQNGQAQLNVNAELPKGLYTLRIKGTEHTVSKKVIKH